MFKGNSKHLAKIVAGLVLALNLAPLAFADSASSGDYVCAAICLANEESVGRGVQASGSNADEVLQTLQTECQAQSDNDSAIIVVPVYLPGTSVPSYPYATVENACHVRGN